MLRYSKVFWTEIKLVIILLEVDLFQSQVDKVHQQLLSDRRPDTSFKELASFLRIVPTSKITCRVSRAGHDMNLHDEIVEDDGTNGFLGEASCMAPWPFLIFWELGSQSCRFSVAPGGKSCMFFSNISKFSFLGAVNGLKST